VDPITVNIPLIQTKNKAGDATNFTNGNPHIRIEPIEQAMTIVKEYDV
jgi:hypothetical protein